MKDLFSKSLALLLFLVLPAAANTSLTQSEDLQLTAEDYESFFLLFPAIDREAMIANEEVLKDRILDMHSDAAIEKIAVDSGIERDPLLAARLKRARQQLIVLTFMEGLGGQMPSSEVLEDLAEEQYLLKKKKLFTNEERQVAHILIGDATNCACETKTTMQRAQEIIEQIESGESFEELALEYSTDPGSAANGGHLPNPVTRNGMTVPQFEDATFALKDVGDISPPVKTQFGIHIIKLIAVEPARQLSYNEVREELRNEVLLDIKSSAQTKMRARAYPIIDEIDFEGLRKVLRKLNQDR